MCDLSKAFDSVNNQILLNKLKELRIDAFWLRDYLRNRTQSVRIDKHVSDKLDVSHGVPQGSGPVFFIAVMTTVIARVVMTTLYHNLDKSFVISL